MEENKGKKNISLSAAEREQIKERILFFMRTHPFTSVSNRPAFFVWEGFRFFYQGRAVAISLFLLIILAGAGSVLANDALPNDLLYPFKRNVNERVAGWIALGSKAEALLQTRLATERLEEAEKLALRGELDEETSQTIKESFALHTIAVKERMLRLRENKDLESALSVSSALESTFAVHQSALSSINAENDAVSEIARKVSEEFMAVSESRAGTEEMLRSEARINNARSAEAARKRAERKMKETNRLVRSKEVDEWVTGGLAEVSDDYKAGEALIDANAYADAVVTFKKVEKKAEGAKVAVKLKDELGIDVIGNVTLGVAADASISASSSSATTSLKSATTSLKADIINEEVGEASSEAKSEIKTENQGTTSEGGRDRETQHEGVPFMDIN